MSNEEIRQRIAYLVEHGGLYDDPGADTRRWMRMGAIALGLLTTLSLIELFILLVD